MTKKITDDTTPYVVVATAFGHKNQQISAALDKANADVLADRLKEAMKDIESDFKVFADIKVVKYEVEPLNPHKQKNDPYDYSVLDALDKKIAKNK